jgi:adenylate cyclase
MAYDYPGLVDSILATPWVVRDGLQVPDTSTVSLSDGAVKMRVTMLYADLADSTELASTQDARAVARIYKSFLACCSRLIGKTAGRLEASTATA